MSNTLALIKIELLNMYGLNRLLQGKKKKEETRWFLFTLVALATGALIAYLSVTYSKMIIMVLDFVGEQQQFTSILVMIVSAIIFSLSILKIQGFLFAFKDYDILMSLPLGPKAILAGKLSVLYIINVVIALFIMIPSGIIYGIHASKGAEFYLLLTIGILFVPLVPIVLSGIIGSFISFLSSFFKRTTVMQIALSCLMIFGIMALSFRMTNIKKLTSISKSLSRIYPLGVLFNKGLEEKLWWLGAFILISLLLAMIFIWILSWKYSQINTNLMSRRTKANFKMKELKVSKVSGALYKKEIKRYLASPIYVLNTAFGPLLLIVVSIAMIVLKNEMIESMLELPGFTTMAGQMLPLFISFFVALTCTTGSAISLEGKQLWISKVIPVRIIDIFHSKIMVNISIIIPAIVISNILLMIKFSLAPIDVMFLFLLPFALTAFISFLGLICNLLFPNFEWKTEAQVVKRGASNMIALLVSLGLVIFLFVVKGALPFSNHIFYAFITILISFISAAMYVWLREYGIEIYKKF